MVNGNFRPKESLFHVENRGSNPFNPISEERHMLLRHVDSLCINTIKKKWAGDEGKEGRMTAKLSVKSLHRDFSAKSRGIFTTQKLAGM